MLFFIDVKTQLFSVDDPFLSSGQLSLEFLVAMGAISLKIWCFVY